MTHLTNFLYITLTNNLKTVFGSFPGVILDTVGYYTANPGHDDIFHPVLLSDITYTITYISNDNTSSTNIPTHIGKYDIRVDASLSPNPLGGLIPMNGYFTSKWDPSDLNNSDIGIVNTYKSLSIDKGIASITLNAETFTYNGLSPTATIVTDPPNLDCIVTYNGSLIAPTSPGSYQVSATVIDQNYKSPTPVIATHNIVMDTGAMASQLNFKTGLLTPEGKASLKDPSGFITDTLLYRLDVPQINAISTIASIADCAVSLPEKLMIAVTAKALSLLLAYVPGLGIANLIKQIIDMIEEAEAIIALIQDIRNNPLSFLDGVLEGAGVYASINDQIHALEQQFPNIPGIAEILKDIDNVCNKQDYSIFGLPSPGRIKSDPTLQPKTVAPTPMPTFNPVSNNAKTAYDAFLERLNGAIAKDIPKMTDLKKLEDEGDTTKPFSNYITMITAVTTLIYSFHDDIKITTDSSKDKILQQKSIDNGIMMEKSHPEWQGELLKDFLTRCIRGKLEIVKNTDVIRAYFMKNVLQPPGGIQNTGCTLYGPGKQTPGGWDASTTSENASGQQGLPPYIGTRDGDPGAYQLPLRSDFTIASTRWPGGSIIALTNPDGTPYNPSGKNVAGQYTVVDVGAFKNGVSVGGTGSGSDTYHHPDIFTTDPTPYGGPYGNSALNKVKASVVSIGTNVTNPKYIAAHKLYASESTTTNGATNNA